MTIIHETEKPYEATVYATSGSCTLRGLKIAHRSPSVANNYAVFAQGAKLTLEVSGVQSALLPIGLMILSFLQAAVIWIHPCIKWPTEPAI